MKWRDSQQGQLATKALEMSDGGQHDAALELLDQARQLAESDPMVMIHRGHVLREMREYSAAETVLRDAIGIISSLPEAWNELGLVMEEQHLYERAAFCYEYSAGLRPDKSVLTELARVQLVFDPAASIESAERALSLDPNWEEAQDIVREAKRELG